MKTRSIAVLAATLLALTASAPGFAQDEPSDAQAEPAAAQEEGSTEQPAAAEEQGSAGEPAAAEEEGSAEEPTDGEAGQAEPADEEAASEGERDDQPPTGPGGKPLREDYPGTEESKKARMDTERIEGLSFDEGRTPEDGYDVRIRELETKVDDLKEKVFRSKSRIVLLKETVLSGNLAGSRAIVSHENALGGAYELRRVHYALDGSRVFNQSDDKLDASEEIEIFNGAITPGNHRVSILLELKGTGYGLFSYMDDYKFTIKDSCEFTAQEGRSSIVSVRLIDQGGALASYEERPGVECVLSSVKLSGDDLKAKVSGNEGGSKQKAADDDGSAAK